MNFHDIKLFDIIEKILGKDLADQFAKEIDQGLQKGLKGKDLQDHVQTVVNKYKDKIEEKKVDTDHLVGVFIVI